MKEPMIPGGAILLSRKIFDSAISKKPPLYLNVWIYLLAHAQHRDYKGLKRGQLITSIPKIQEAMSWKVGYRSETPSKKQIFGILEWLRFPSEGNDEGNEAEPMIVTTKVTHGLLITICNYDIYQTLANYEGNGGGNNEKLAKGQRKESGGNNINKNDNKNDKNGNNNNTSKKPKKRVYLDDDPNKKLANVLYQRIQENINIKEPDLDSWANVIRLTIEADKRSGKDVQDMIIWATQHDFWSGVIQSPSSLRKHFDKMLVQKNRGSSNNSNKYGPNGNELIETGDDF